MDPTLSWIDATEVRAALAQVRGTESATPAPAYPTPNDTAPMAPAFTPIEPLSYPATVAARVQALARWIEQNLRPQRWFLADDQGLSIHDAGFGDARIGELIHSMRDWRPGRRPTAIEAVTYHLTGERKLITMWVQTRIGPTAIALENPTTDALSLVRKAVEYAFKGKAQ